MVSFLIIITDNQPLAPVQRFSWHLNALENLKMLTCCTCNRHVYKVTCRFIGFSVFSSYKLPSLCSPHTHPVTNTVYEPPIWRDPELSTVVHLTHLDSFSPLVSLLLCSNLDSQTGRDCSCPAQCLLTFWLFFCLFVLMELYIPSSWVCWLQVCEHGVL